MSCDWVRRLFRCPFLSRSKLSLLAHSHICKKSVPNTTALTTIDNWHAHMSYEIEPKQPFLLLVYSHVSSKKTEINVTLLHFKCEIEPLVKWTGDSYFPNGIEPVFKWWSTIRVVVAPPAAANPIELDHVLADAMVLIETWCCVCAHFFISISPIWN